MRPPADPGAVRSERRSGARDLTRWLQKGVGLKRWLLLLAVTSLGFGVATALLFLGFGGGKSGALAFALILFYMGALVVATRRVLQFLEKVAGLARTGNLESFFAALARRDAPRIVAVGGGTGLSTLLRGFREYGRAGSDKNITAIVTVTDDGGSSGRLREELHILPPGDIRNCLAALSHEESLLLNLFQYRFPPGSSISGHSFGNLFLAAMTGVTGRFDRAIEASSAVLAVRGKVLPSTLEQVRLIARFDDGSTATGETAISSTVGRRIRSLAIEPPDARPIREAVEAIRAADAIVLGPGSLYTSILPNLLIREIREAILASPAPRIFVTNVMTQPGETDGFSVADHVETLAAALGGMPHLVVANESPMPSPLLTRYAARGAKPVAVDPERVRGMGVDLRLGDFLYDHDYLRHDPAKLADFLIGLIEERSARAPH